MQARELVLPNSFGCMVYETFHRSTEQRLQVSVRQHICVPQMIPIAVQTLKRRRHNVQDFLTLFTWNFQSIEALGKSLREKRIRKSNERVAKCFAASSR